MDVRNFSNLRQSSRKLAHQFDFSNIVDDPIEVKEVEDPSQDNEQGSAYGAEASSGMIPKILEVHLMRQR